MGLRADKACIDRCAIHINCSTHVFVVVVVFVSYKSGYNFFIKEIGNS